MIANGLTTSKKTGGFTLIELMISLVLGVLVLVSIANLSTQALQTDAVTRESQELEQDARFAMQSMVTAVLGTKRLLLPLANNPNTNWRENVREQTVPPSAPEGSSILATAVLAVTLDPNIDTDGDGYADGDNDKDGRVDEDTSDDQSNDREAGIVGIDDDGDGNVDESLAAIQENDNDEDDLASEDSIDGIDNDSDGTIDEDLKSDMNNDGAPGILAFDDDADGLTDEGNMQDDDEDDLTNEDWFDNVVFFLGGTTLIERRPVINPVDGNDYEQHPIAENITRFRVERVPQGSGRSVLIDLTLETTGTSGKVVSLNTRVRVGGGQ